MSEYFSWLGLLMQDNFGPEKKIKFEKSESFYDQDMNEFGEKGFCLL